MNRAMVDSGLTFLRGVFLRLPGVLEPDRRLEPDKETHSTTLFVLSPSQFSVLLLKAVKLVSLQHMGSKICPFVHSPSLLAVDSKTLSTAVCRFSCRLRAGQKQEVPCPRGRLELQTSPQSPWTCPSGSSVWTTCSGSRDPQRTVGTKDMKKITVFILCVDTVIKKEQETQPEV